MRERENVCERDRKGESQQLNTGWRRPRGCLKLQFIFRKRATNYRALMRKMTYKDKASYGSSPPCMNINSSYRVAKTHRIPYLHR